MPLLSCPGCRLWQYAAVSYVTTVSCVECGQNLNLSAPRHGRALRAGPRKGLAAEDRTAGLYAAARRFPAREQ